MAKEILVAYGVDVDAVAGWLGSYGGENSPDDISRGLFAGEVGTPRLLKLFDRYDLKTTWFIPGHSIETFPAETEQVVAGGHEIGIHGYTHENPIAMTREQETAVLDKCIGLVEQVSGKRPTGYVAPWWEFSNVTNELLLERGHQVRPLAHAPRLPAVLRPRRRLLDEDRLREAGRGVDGAARARRGDRPRRDPRELVPRRPAADDVHQDGAEQPRVRQPPGHRAAVDGSVRLGLPRVRLRGLHDDDPPRRERPPGRARDARADHRAHQRALRHPLGDVRRDRRRLRAAFAPVTYRRAYRLAGRASVPSSDSMSKDSTSPNSSSTRSTLPASRIRSRSVTSTRIVRITTIERSVVALPSA